MHQKIVSSTFRVFDTELAPDKIVRFALLKVYGLGLYRATIICNALGISNDIRVKHLKEEDILRIQNIAKELKWLISSDLKQTLIMNYARLDGNGCRRGKRRRDGLPCHGGRTHSNGCTARKLRGKI